MKRFAPTLAMMLAALHAQAAPTVPAPHWGPHFASRGVTGTFVLFEPAADRTLAFNETRAAERFLPASTFKIPHALIGLETGAVADEHEVFRWDGKPKRFDAWERDHTLASAMRKSVVWVFQSIARRVGKPAMGEWLDRLDYGNRDMTGGIDLFWLQGGLRISALEQVEFLRKLGEGRLPVGSRSRRIVRDAMLAERCGDAVIRGKTGTAIISKDGIAWWVGWVEREGDPVAYFAMNYRTLDHTPREVRFDITRAILEEAGILRSPREACKAA